MEPSLINISIKKEIIHWKRMRELFKDMVGIGGMLIAYPLLVITISICHYAFAIMHISFEFILFIFNRKQFKENMNKIYEELQNKKLNPSAT